jgi:hypothetical protein
MKKTNRNYLVCDKSHQDQQLVIVHSKPSYGKFMKINSMKKQIVTILGIVALAAASANAAVTITIANPVTDIGNHNLTALASAGNAAGDWQAFSAYGTIVNGVIKGTAYNNVLGVIQKSGGSLLTPTTYAGPFVNGFSNGPQNYNWTDAAATGFSTAGVGSQSSGVFWRSEWNNGTPFSIGLNLAANTEYTINLFAGDRWTTPTLTATFGAQTVTKAAQVPEYGNYVIKATTGADDAGLLTLSFNNTGGVTVDAIAVSAMIPEPSTGALLGFGLGGLVMTRLMRRKQS